MQRFLRRTVLASGAGALFTTAAAAQQPADGAAPAPQTLPECVIADQVVAGFTVEAKVADSDRAIYFARAEGVQVSVLLDRNLLATNLIIALTSDYASPDIVSFTLTFLNGGPVWTFDGAATLVAPPSKFLNPARAASTLRFSFTYSDGSSKTIDLNARKLLLALEAGDSLAVRLAERYRAGTCRVVNTSKVVCTMMNTVYGVGAFRNNIWLMYSQRYLRPEHERGYHRMAAPLLRFAYGGSGRLQALVRGAMEWAARERTADLWAEMRGRRRRVAGRLVRCVLEPLSFAVGLLPGGAPQIEMAELQRLAAVTARSAA